MSGGAFDYKEWHIGQIAEELEQELIKQGTLKERHSRFDDEYYEKYPEEAHYATYPEDIHAIDFSSDNIFCVF